MLGSVASANFEAALRLLRTLQSFGLERLVLCPGSRSGPLATAAGRLASSGDLHLITAVDERSAAFLALGQATATGTAVAVVTTSGTAVANLLPAAVEADRSCQPLLLLTADRPARLKGCGANQTVNQEDFLQPVCRWFGEGPPEGLHQATPEALRDLAFSSWCQAHGHNRDAPGPVHLNLPFEEPLHASIDQQATVVIEPLASTQDVQPTLMDVSDAPRLDPSRPGVVVAGPWRGLSPQLKAYQQAVQAWLLRSGWPLLADPLSALPIDLPGRLHHWDLLLDRLSFDSDGQVLRLGPMPASRRLERWLADLKGGQLVITEGEQRTLDPIGVATQWNGGVAAWLAQQGQSQAGAELPWPRLDRQIGHCLDRLLPCQGPVTEPALARALGALLPAQLPVMLAASSPVRDWMLWSGSGGSNRRCFSFRGASGIDGTLSLAMGLVMAQGRTVLITGDLALLHDSNGWLHAQQQSPPLLVVLIDNGGGGIFQQLPIETDSEQHFDRLFAMPQQVDPLALASAYGIQTRQLACLEDLPDALDWGLIQEGPALLRVCADRRADAVLREDLRAAAQNVALMP